MLLFPAYLTHMVTPYAGKSPRISISLNLWVEDRINPCNQTIAVAASLIS